MLGHEVAYSDGAHLAIGEELLERSVGVEGAIEFRGNRLMEDQEVELLDPQLAGALFEPVPGRLVAIVVDPDLRLDEHFLAAGRLPAGCPRRPRARFRMRQLCQRVDSRRGAPPLRRQSSPQAGV